MAAAAPDTIFKATYSSVPVYEMPCKGVAVMKRRSDGWLNATQILKVAGFDKPQRTRVLEREVQKGTHEKVQGGYGKYQGTWIPPDRGLDLAKQYGVDAVLMPIIEYVPPRNGSPPPAPKHVTAAPKGPRQKRTSTPGKGAAGAAGAASSSARGSMPPPLPPIQTQGAASGKGSRSASVASGGGNGTATPTSAKSARGAAAAARNELAAQQAQHLAQQQAAVQQAQAQQQQQQQQPQYYYPSTSEQQHHLANVENYDDSGVTSPPLSAGSEISRTPSPLGSEAASEYDSRFTSQYPTSQQQPRAGAKRGRKRKHQDQHPQQAEEEEDDLGAGAYGSTQAASGGGPAYYARAILEYYVSESASIPSFLISPPPDFDPNVVIDDDGHTALHWACAMGRLRIVKLLLTAGADIFRANAIGQTSLMRSVMFTNNYDLRKFPEMFELLHRSTINIDRTDRTVFHYAIDLALTKNKPHAAKYYLEVLLERLKEYPREVADILNFQDEEGETALTLAARARFKGLVRILLNHGADAKITNRDGKSAEDYILEDERYRHPDGQADAYQQQLVGQQPIDMTMDANGNMQPLALPPHLHPQPPTLGLSQQQVNGAPYFLDTNGQPIPAQNLPQQQSQSFVAVPGSSLPASMPGSALAQPLALHYSETAQRITAQLGPQITAQLELLADTYDVELEAQERDITQAHTLLASIQAEAVEQARIVQSLKSQAEQSKMYASKEQQLRSELKDKMGKRFRLGWEKYVRDEEERQKSYVTITRKNGAQDGISAHEIVFNAKSASSAKGLTNGESETATPADMQYLFSALPQDASSLSTSISEAVAQLSTLKSKRKELFDTFVTAQAETGSAKMTDYRKLIALGCGITLDEVDQDFVRNVLENLDNGDELLLAQSLSASEITTVAE